jgi:predicted Zn-ribbon and HTH transcriptional regulator
MIFKHKKAICLRCGWSWIPRVENPASCPHCKNPKWNIPREKKNG